MKSKLFGLLAGASIYALAVQPAAADGIAGTAQAIILTQTGHSVPNEVFVAEGKGRVLIKQHALAGRVRVLPCDF